MLYTKELDTESFEDITRSAVEEISKVYSPWTNFSVADPGITIIELLAWLSEVSRYHLNVIDDNHVRRYLKLLGVEQRTAAPAKVYLKVSGGREVPLLSRFYSEQICFETTRRINILDGDIESISSGKETLKNTDFLFENNAYGMAFDLFGKNGSADFFELNIQGVPEPDDIIGIYFSIKKPAYMKEIQDGYMQPVNIKVKLIAGDNEYDLETASDETRGFCRSGVIRLHVGKINSRGMTERKCRLRFIIEDGEYVEYPVLQAVAVNVTEAYQTRTISKVVRHRVIDKVFYSEYPVDELYGIGDNDRRVKISKYSGQDIDGSYVMETAGYDEVEVVSNYEGYRGRGARLISEAPGICNFQIDFDAGLKVSGADKDANEDKDGNVENALRENTYESILEDSIVIYIQETDGVYHWERKNDFDASDKYSRHYIYDDEKKKIIFGDGIKGMAPVGKIYLMGCAFSADVKGNIKQGGLNCYNEQTGLRAVNITSASGGNRKESLKEASLRAVREVADVKRCVTLEDYENEVKNTPAVPIRRLRAFCSTREENSVIVAVECTKGAKRLTKNSMYNLKRNLEGKGMIGTSVTFIPTGYCRMCITVGILAGRQAKEHVQEIKELIENYFDGDKVRPGGLITKAQLADYIVKLPYIDSVRNIEFGVLATGATVLKNGDLMLDNDCLPDIERIDITISGRDE